MSEEKLPKQPKKAAAKKKEKEPVETNLNTKTLDEIKSVVVEEGEVDMLTVIKSNSVSDSLDHELQTPAIGEEEIVTEEGPSEEELLSEKIELASAGLEETEQIKKTLSTQAEGWKKWLAYQKITPEDWLDKYPTHKMKHLVQEIIDFNSAKSL